MFVTTHASGKNKQNVYVYIMEGFRDKDGKIQKRIVQNLGRLSELQAKDPDALEKLKAQYKNERLEKKSVVANQRLEQMNQIINAAEQSSSQSEDVPALDYAHYPLRNLWEGNLNFDRKIKYLQRSFGKSFDLNAALQYLVFHKVINPCSVMSAYSNKDYFLGDPVGDISLDQFYEVYDFVAQYHNEIFAWVNRKLDDNYGKDRATLVFYDVTNAYFETALTDAEKEDPRDDFNEIVQEVALQWRTEGRLEDDCFDEDDNLIVENLPETFWQELVDDKLVYFRMRGPSKEHRFDLPIVSIALVIDRNGLPMDVAVYSGNSSEFKTMQTSIEELKKKYNVGSSIVVADRGLNSLDNLTMLQDAEFGFLMAQKVTQFKPDIAKKMLDRSLYTPFNPKNPDAGGYQVIKNWKKTGSGGKQLDCTLVLTYDEKRKRRDEAILETLVEIVKAKQKAGVKIGPRKTGWAALAKTKTGVDQEILGIDEEELKKKRVLCGFAAMVYKAAPPPKNDKQHKVVKEAELSGEQIAGTYRMLNHIETCFRTMKSHLGLRPMFVRLATHIKAHVDICVLALLLTRMIQKNLEKQGYALSPRRISQALQAMQVAPIKGNGDQTFFISLGQRVNYRRDREKVNTPKIVELLKEGKLAVSDKKLVLQACDMEPLPRFCSRAELARCLGTRFPTDQDAFSAIIQETL